MLGWAADYLSGPVPPITFAVLLALGVATHRRLARRTGWSPWPTLGALVALAAIAAITLPPGPGAGLDGPSWAALRACGRALTDPATTWQALTTGRRGERVANTLLFVPLAFFGVLATRRPWPVLLGTALLPVPVEVAQALAGAGRACAGFDWATNGLGALLGTLAGALALQLARVRLRRDRVGIGEPSRGDDAGA